MHPAAGKIPRSLNRVGPGVMLAFMMACASLSDRVRDEEVTVGAVERHPSLELLEFRAVALDWVDDTTVAVLDRDDQQIVLLGVADGSQRRGARRRPGRA